MIGDRSAPTGTLAADIAARLERQLEVAQKITHIGSWEWEIGSGRLTWSDELFRIYGVEPRSQEPTFEWFIDRVHPEDRERVQGDIQRALARGGRFQHRERVVRPDGSVRDLDTVGEVLTDKNGTPTSLLGTCRDITEERRREETIRLYADIVDHMQIGLSVWMADMPRDPQSLRLIAYNPACEVATGVSLAGAVGKTLAQIFPAAMQSELPGLLAAVDAQTPVLELQACRFGDPGNARVFAVKVFALPQEGVALALEDITARWRGERLQAGERHALEKLAAGVPLAEILADICRYIEELVPETVASILMLDAAGTHLKTGAAPSLPEAMNRAIDGQAIGPQAGSCGTAAYRREPVFVDDIEHDPLWSKYKELALPFGFRACWSHPLLANDGHVLGTFALYYREKRLPDEDTLQIIRRTAHVVGMAIERRALDDQLRALNERMDAAREDERTGIAREIHDQLGQSLTALKLDIAWLTRRSGSGDGEAVREKLAEMSKTADEILHSVRRISAELRPGVLDDLGLEAAIEWQAEDFHKRTGTPIEVRARLGDVRLDRHLATSAFRIFQEALTNVTRHAGASRVEVDLRLDKGQLVLEVADDGVGLPTDPRGGSLGLLGMRERARRLGGDCLVARREPRGTLVTLRLPLRFPADTSPPGIAT